MEDDFVEYYIYNPKSIPGHEINDLRDSILEVLAPYLIDYLWHIDRFNVQIGKSKPGEPAFLTGKVVFGDNIEDEWFVVGLLFKLTEMLDVVVSVKDSDGELILIEAAEKLPKWAQEPELADGRVFIYKGEVHIIPIPRTPAELTPLPSSIRPSPFDAVQTVVNYSEITRARDAIQLEIKKRLKSYPDDWSEQQHFTHLLVPTTIRAVIKEKPQLMSAAIRTFFTRDFNDLRACRQMKNFPPKDLVKTRVRLSKCLYAMLSKPRFLPDKQSGFVIPPESHPDYKASVLGMKMTCGFEIIASRARKIEEESGKLDVSSERYKKFLKRLTDTGFFQNELEGSKKYTELIKKANDYFISFDGSEVMPNARFSSELLKVMENFSNDMKIESELDDNLPSDDESWLDVCPDSFDNLLRQHFRLGEGDPSSGSDQPTQAEIPSEVKRFLQGLSDFDGIQVHHNKTHLEDDMLNLDPDAFGAALKKAMDMTEEQLQGVRVDDDDDEDSDDDEIDLDNDEASEAMSSYFNDMTQELSGTKVASGDCDEWTKPMNIDSTVLKNLLESFKSQDGMAGPASTLLEPLGIRLDKNPSE